MDLTPRRPPAPKPPSRLLTAGVGVTIIAALLLPGTVAPALGLSAPTIAGQHLRGEAADYATDLFGDPWDYDDSTDVLVDAGPVVNATQIAIAGGRLGWAMDTTSHFHPVWPGFPGGLRLGRDGPASPIDATRYTHVSVRLSSTVATTGLIAWQTCPDITGDCEGRVPFVVEDIGWQTVTVDLRSGAADPWEGEPVGLRFTIGTAQPAKFELDWMRLHATAEPATIQYTTSVPGTTTLLWDADDDRGNNTPDNPGWGPVTATDGLTGAAQFDVAAHPAGTYRFYTTSDVSTSAYSEPLTIQAAPRISILNPDVTGGEDFAAAVLGDPWDFSNPEDVAQLGNTTNATFADGMLHGTNGGDSPRDPFLVLSGIGDVNAGRYHRFTITASYDGPFDLSWEPGGGTHGRVSWRQNGHHLWQQTKPVVTYPGIDTYTVVLGSGPPQAVMEPDLGQPGWNSGTTTHELRWDVNEDIGPKRWRIDEVRLAADDESFGSFDIEWLDRDNPPGTTLAVYADTDRAGFDGVLVADAVASVPGRNHLRWDTSALPAGEYWVHVTATSPSGVARSRSYATGPLQVRAPRRHHEGEPPGIRLAGPDRIATGIELSKAGFPGVAHTAIITRAGDFPDALAAAPLAAAIDAPLLLNEVASLTPAVRAELERLQVQRVILLGGTAAQSAAVEAELRSFVDIVDRADGVNRFHTAAIVAERSVEEWAIRGHRAGPPVLALGSRFEDALAAASMAGHARRPLLLASHDVVPSWTARSLGRLGARHVTVFGGHGIIQPALLDGLGALLDSVDVLTGSDHIETAALGAGLAVAAGARGDIVLVASGDAFPDALAAGPAVIAQGGVLLLTPRDAVGEATAAYLESVRISSLWIAGGPAAVSTEVAAALALAADLTDA